MLVRHGDTLVSGTLRTVVRSCLVGAATIAPPRPCPIRSTVPPHPSSHLGLGRTHKRPFHDTALALSAWPLGRDAAKRTEAGQQDEAHGSNEVHQRAASLPPGERAITIRDIQEHKVQHEPIAMLTAYDYPSALGLRSAALDICLVGDSLTNVALGHRTTQPLSLETMVHHVEAVARGLRHPMLNQHGMPPVPLLIADVPMGYAEVSIEEGMRAAVALVKRGTADGVKMEGGRELVPLVRRLAQFGIPVMAHIGLQPQRSSSGSALNLAGRTATEAWDLLLTARLMEQAGAFACLLECIPARVGQAISQRLAIPTIGIGAGPDTDGQVLVTDDVLGECNSPLYVLAGLHAEGQGDAVKAAHAIPRPAAHTPSLPRFVRNFVGPLTGGSTIGALRMAAVRAYVDAVKQGTFPDQAELYKINKEEWARFKQMLAQYDANPSQEDLPPMAQAPGRINDVQ